jgi:ParB family chromosome partitioning protein
LQNLTVKPAFDETGAETGYYEVVAGARRLAALKLLVKQKRIRKNHAVPCAVIAGSAQEISLAENLFQLPMHPADQYEAFARLHAEDGMAAEDIAARFGVTPAIVERRLRLGAVSPKLMDAYRAGQMTLEQLMAFTITTDHRIQEQVCGELSWNKSREMIKRLLTEGHVDLRDRAALFVGASAYLAAGGHIIRDLFDEEHEGYCADAALLNRLVQEKLAEAVETVKAEGWRWVEAAPDFHYGMTAGLRRVFPQTAPLHEAEAERLGHLEAALERLCDEHQDDADPPQEAAAQIEVLEIEIKTLRGVDIFAPADIAVGGAFVSIGSAGSLRVERGFIRPDDDPRNSAADREQSVPSEKKTENEAGDDDDRLSDKLITELTAHRTAALRLKVAETPRAALIALIHAAVLQTFYGDAGAACIDVAFSSESLDRRAPDLEASAAVKALDKRQARIQKTLPSDPAHVWEHIAQLDADAALSLLAVAIAPSVNALKLPWERQPPRLTAAASLGEATGLDMAAFWSPTADSYFGRVTKALILDAVREAVSPDAAARIAGLKKAEMARAAERLMQGKRWLPEILRGATYAQQPEMIAAE